MPEDVRAFQSLNYSFSFLLSRVWPLRKQVCVMHWGFSRKRIFFQGIRRTDFHVYISEPLLCVFQQTSFMYICRVPDSYSIYCLCVGVCMPTCVYVYLCGHVRVMCICGTQKNSEVPPSRSTGLKSSGLVASAFICWDIWPSPVELLSLFPFPVCVCVLRCVHLHVKARS